MTKKLSEIEPKLKKKVLPIAIPIPLFNRLRDYVENYNREATMTKLFLTGLGNELDRRFAEIHAYERTKAAIEKERSDMKTKASSALKTKSKKDTGRTKKAGPLGTLAASHVPVNGPALPEGGTKS